MRSREVRISIGSIIEMNTEIVSYYKSHKVLWPLMKGRRTEKALENVDDEGTVGINVENRMFLSEKV